MAPPPRSGFGEISGRGRTLYPSAEAVTVSPGQHFEAQDLAGTRSSRNVDRVSSPGQASSTTSERGLPMQIRRQPFSRSSSEMVKARSWSISPSSWRWMQVVQVPLRQ